MNPTAEIWEPPEIAFDSGMSKTLHHGLLILRLLSEHPQGLTVADVAERIGVHRTVAHRLARTLEAHQLCRRDHQRRLVLGTGLVTLAEPVEQDLRTLARPLLDELAETTQATVHLMVREGARDVRALMVVEPRGAGCTCRSGPARPTRSSRARAASPSWPADRTWTASAPRSPRRASRVTRSRWAR
ncbi:helix-turn-helix domain-containing protein [Streptomyces sp. M19]